MLFSSQVQRYVVDLGSEYLVDEDGIRSDTAWWALSSVKRSVADLSPERSLAILGEPGIGKSTTITCLVGDDPSVNYVRLDEATDVHMLEELLAPTVSTLATGRRRTLVLDGVDECPLAPKTLVRRVGAALSGCSRLRVVVGCRTADWPASLGAELRNTLGSLDVLELLPLSAEDIVALASSRELDGVAFLKAVRGAAAGPLATLPLTLDLLMNLYEEGGLPTNARGLYERGLMLLADEPDKDRAFEQKPVGSAGQRLAIAARIAAVLMLCGRSAIDVVGPSGEEDLPVGELAAGAEPLPAGEFAVTAELVNATLATGLFSGRGPGRIGIRHASFASYLTARYLHAHQVPEHQLRALLTRTSSLGRTSVPSRLRETAAWLVAFAPDRNGWFVDLDPVAIVAHSALVDDHHARAGMVSGLLDDGDVDRSTSRRRWRLTHPGLADQLRPALRAPLDEDAGPDFGHPVSRRAYTAIEIARQSVTRDVAPEVADLVARAELNPYLRSSAAHCLVEIDPGRAQAVLRVVLDEVLEHPDHDPHDDLRGSCLSACWPTNLTVPDLLRALTPAQDRHYIGSYQIFLNNFVDAMTDEAVEQMVRGVATHAVGGTNQTDDLGEYDDATIDPAMPLLTGPHGDRLFTSLLERALASPRLETFVEEAGWLIAESARRNQRRTLPLRFAWGEGSDEDEDMRGLRRALVLASLRHVEAPRASLLVHRWSRPDPSGPGTDGRLRPALVGGDDLAWLFTLAPGPYADHAGALIRYVYEPTNLTHQEIASENWDSQILAASIGHWFEAVDLAGPEATRMREQHEWSDSAPSWLGAESHPAVLAAAWARCKSGDAAAFAEVCLRLRTDPQTGYADALDTNIAGWPSIHLLDADSDELANAAYAYLTTVHLSAGDWLESAGTISYQALDGYAGLSLLARRPDAPAWFDRLSDEIWLRWTPAVIRCPVGGGDDSHAVHDELLLQLAARVPDAFVEAYLMWTEHCHAAGWPLSPLEPLEGFRAPEIDDRLSALLTLLLESVNATHLELRSLPDDAESPGVRNTRANVSNRLSEARRNAVILAAFLCARGHRPTIALLETVLGTGEQSGSEIPDARRVAAAALLSSETLGWPRLFGLMQADEQFGRAVTCDLARGQDEVSLLRTLDEAQLGGLWTWLNEGWSSDTDTFPNGVVGDDHRVRSWRDDVLHELTGRATSAALGTLATLAGTHPEVSRLHTALHDAETRQRDESWHGPTFEELMALVADARRTVVHDDDALYRLVLSVLERFAARLQHVGQLLWNETRSADGTEPKVWRPKYEPDVSALLKDHLEQELADRLVVNREVLVRQTTSKGHGLSVDVLASGGSSELSTGRLPQCPIEVKGSWNRGLLTDLQTQLVDDYLPAVGASRGVYVCAWFSVDDWDDMRDARRPTAAAKDRDTVTRQLHEAAERASTSRGVRVAAVVVDVPRPRPSNRKQAKG